MPVLALSPSRARIATILSTCLSFRHCQDELRFTLCNLSLIASSGGWVLHHVFVWLVCAVFVGGACVGGACGVCRWCVWCV